MVFSRSEHLARHARKHTGEKPYKCIVPNCDRTFSRIDNMMQHTHTHSRNKKKSPLSSSPKSVPDDNMMINVPPTSPKINFQPTTHNNQSMPSPIYNQKPIQEQQQNYSPILMSSTRPYPPWPYPSPKTSPSSFNEPKNNSPDSSPIKKTFFQTLDNRRYIDLAMPIQHVGQFSIRDEERVTVTADEYEALEGFGQFCTKPREHQAIPVRFSQIYTFRQHIHLVQESWIRRTYFG
ncbi:hypothetical protein G6F62_009364 [Rhizopus arrhizus]|nr:hypothetical protein G6F62_009364 [Rhizopus arrhizus]